MRRVERVLRAHHARIELGEIDDALAGALGGFRSSGSAPRATPSSRRTARACSSASNSVISPAARSPGRACCSRSVGERIETAGLALRVIQHLLLDVAERHAGLAVVFARFHAVDDVERRKAELAERQRCASRRRPLSRRRDARSVQRILLPSPSSLNAQKLSIGSALERTRDASADPSWRVHVGAAHQEQQAVRQRRARARCPRRPRAPGGGASPCAMAVSVLAVRAVLPRTIW